jgi:6-phosphogluconolactonase (cycloisomerase 2 family)
MAVFSYMDGKVAFSGLDPVYGSYPRQFDISQNELVATALQKSHAVAVTQWDDGSDSLGPLLAKKDLVGQITAVVWGV